MIYFELEPVAQVHDARLLLGMAEVYALVSGAFSLDDFAFDNDGLLHSFIDSQSKEERDELNEEPQHALTLARETIETAIREEAATTASKMGQHYPFRVSNAQGLILEANPKAEINEYGWCYVALQLFALEAAKLLSFGKDEHEIENDPRASMRREFFALFEVISGIVAANKVDGIPVFLSDCRSSGKLIGRLGRACRTFGSGQTRPKAMLGQLDIAANDGGIDAVIGSFGPWGLRATSLVGATVQVSDLRRKRIGQVEIDRLLRFLVSDLAWKPVAGYLVHPEPFDVGRHLICQEANCGYLCREDIILGLRPLTLEHARTPRTNLAIKALARGKLKKLKQLRFQLEFQHLGLAD